CFFFFSSGAPRPLPSFPTRRSSDLSGFLNHPSKAPVMLWPASCRGSKGSACPEASPQASPPATTKAAARVISFEWRVQFTALARSEEHTSELQSRFDLVCRLLLEKK